MRKQRKFRKQTIFLFLLFFIPFTMSFPVTYVAAQGEDVFGEHVYINADWLQVDLLEFGGKEIPIGDKLDNLQFLKGGYTFKNFESLGITQENEDGSVVYSGYGYYEFDIAMYTTCLSNNLFEYESKRSGFKWLKTTCAPEGFTDLERQLGHYFQDHREDNNYYVDYEEVDIDDFYPNHYSGSLKMNVKLLPEYNVESGGEVTIAGHQYRMPYLNSTISSIKVIDHIQEPIGLWTNQYKGFQQTESTVRISSTSMDDNDEDKDTVKDDSEDGWDNEAGSGRSVGEAFSTNGWGWGTEEIEYGFNTGKWFWSNKYGQCSGQSKLVPEAIGQKYDLSNDLKAGDGNEFEFYTQNIEIKPGATLDKQEIWYSGKELYIDTRKEDWGFIIECGLMFTRGGYHDEFSRVVGINVENQWMQTRYQAKVRFDVELEPVSQESEDHLQKPEMEIGDAVWDATLYGRDVGIQIDDMNVWDEWARDWSSFWKDVGTNWDNFWNDIGAGWHDFWTDAFKNLGNFGGGITDWITGNLWWIILIGICIVLFFILVKYGIPAMGKSKAYKESAKRTVK